MDFESLFILLIIFSFVARAIGEAMKGKKGPGQQPPRPPQRQRLPGPPRTLEQPPAHRAPPPEQASDLIPDELWQILTGQQRPPARPPLPVEAEDDEELMADEEAGIPAEVSHEDRDVEVLLRGRAEAVRRREQGPDRHGPKIVSLETEPLQATARHAAFHKKVGAADRSVPTVDRGRAAPTLAHIAGAEPNALRRAIVLQEILGKPKGLE